ncbi:MAG: hypothetical protein JWP97_5271 [Labilithrix sp.]|nr:hypothetical protein [Labilithrix sp.]
MDDVTERFLTLAKRELSADDVRVLDSGEPAPEAANVVVARLRDGRHVVATFGEQPKEHDVLERRLGILASTFAESLDQDGPSPGSERSRSRPPVAMSLHEELKALALRARAADAVVIDGDSPVVWGCASVAARPRARNGVLLRDVSDRELSMQDEPSVPGSPAGLHAVPSSDSSPYLESHLEPTAATGNLRMAPPPESSKAVLRDSGPDLASELAGDEQHVFEAQEPEVTKIAIAAIRQLPSLSLLHRGKHLRELSRGAPSYLVLSFSSIYLLCLVFDGDFDELRAERAAQESLPRVERLVQALPPLDPEPPQPMGGVIALNRSRRR